MLDDMLTSRRSAFLCRAFVPLAAFLAGLAVPSAAPQDPAEMGMQEYTLGLFRPGAEMTEQSKALGKEKLAELQQAHLDGMDAMARTGKLVFAGPFVDRPGDDPAQGLLLFENATKAEIEAMVQKDAFVQRKMLRVELLRFYGPKGVTYPARKEYWDPRAKSQPTSRKTPKAPGK